VFSFVFLNYYYYYYFFFLSNRQQTKQESNERWEGEEGEETGAKNPNKQKCNGNPNKKKVKERETGKKGLGGISLLPYNIVVNL